LISLFGCLIVHAQESLEKNIKDNTLLFYGGISIHGSGDIPGFGYGFVFEQTFSPNWLWSLSFDSNLNDSEQLPFIFEDQFGNTINSTQHNVIAGFQITSGVGYRFINKSKHRFALHPGLILRYQASSLNDVETTLFPALTNFPIPIRIIENYNDNSTWAVGVS